MSLKRIIASAVHGLSWRLGFSLRKAKSLSVGRIIMFHGVGDDEYTAAEFAGHLHFLARNFTIVPLAAIAEKIAANEKFTNEVALTFDDGLRNNLTAAYPVLRRLELPATFFVCPGLVEHQNWLWNQEARVRLRSLSVEQRKKILSELETRGSADVEKIVEWMKTLPMQKRQAAESLIRAKTTSFLPTSAQKTKYDIMNWEQLRSLDPDLITIGSHTVNHPILSTLEPAELSFEISESRRLLEEKLERQVDQFCYPNGAHNPAAIAEVHKHYRIAVTTEGGFVKNNNELVQLPRIGIASQPLLSWRLHRPTA